MPQNIYDDPAFFSGYAQLPRFGSGWSEAFEHADFMALLPDVTGRSALDLGCGAGQLTHYLAEAGAAEVVGVDISERMLALAASERAHPRVTYRRATMEELAFQPEQFDLVVSSLALHYVEDYADLMRRVGTWLRPGGVLVYSVEHPLYTASYPDKGWATDADGTQLHWTIDDYCVDGLREPHWFVDGVQKYPPELRHAGERSDRRRPERRASRRTGPVRRGTEAASQLDQRAPPPDLPAGARPQGSGRLTCSDDSAGFVQPCHPLTRWIK